MTKQYTDRDSFLAPARHATDITPSSTEFDDYTRAIMVTEDDVIITGVFEGQNSSHTTGPLKTGILYPFALKKITAVSAGTVKGYW